MNKKINLTLVLLLVMLMGGCATKTDAITAEEPTSEVVNPIQNDADATDIAEMGLPVTPPEDAEQVQYRIIGQEVAEITFTLDGSDYTLRASKTVEGQDLHGVYAPVTEEVEGISADGDGFSTTMEVYTLQQGGQIGTNTINMQGHDTIYLTLVTMDNTTQTESMLSAISNQLIDNIMTESNP